MSKKNDPATTTTPRSMWTPLEDEVLIIFVKKLRPTDYYGTQSGDTKPPAWDRVASAFNEEFQSWKVKFPGINVVHVERDGKSCRSRWKYHVSLARTKRGAKAPMSEEEDEFIIYMQHHLSNKWSQISTALSKRFGTLRTDNDVKNRWNSKLSRIVEQRKAKGIPIPETVPGPDTKAIQMWSYLSNMANGGAVPQLPRPSDQPPRPCVDSKIDALQARQSGSSVMQNVTLSNQDDTLAAWPSASTLAQLQDVPAPLIRRLQSIPCESEENNSSTSTQPLPRQQVEQQSGFTIDQRWTLPAHDLQPQNVERQEAIFTTEQQRQLKQMFGSGQTPRTFEPPQSPCSVSTANLFNNVNFHQSKRDRSYTPSPIKVKFNKHRSHDIEAFMQHVYQPSLLRGYSSPAEITDVRSSDLSSGSDSRSPADVYCADAVESRDLQTPRFSASLSHQLEAVNDHAGQSTMGSHAADDVRTEPKRLFGTHANPDIDTEIRISSTDPSFDSWDITMSKLLRGRLEGSRMPFGDNNFDSQPLHRSPAGKKLASSMLDEHLARRNHPIHPVHHLREDNPDLDVNEIMNSVDQILSEMLGTDSRLESDGLRNNPRQSGSSDADIDPILAVNFDNLWT